MELQIIAFYYFADEVLKSIGFLDDTQSRFTNAEVITVALTAAYFFCGHQRNSLTFLLSHGYMKSTISEGRFNRKLHSIPQDVWKKLFSVLAEYFKQNNDSNEYAVDSFPVSSCDNIRIFNCRLFKNEKHRGYTASKKRYFYGLKVHLLATTGKEPVEIRISTGSESDIKAFKHFELDLPKDSSIYTEIISKIGFYLRQIGTGFDPICITQLFGVELLRWRLRLGQIRASSLIYSRFLKPFRYITHSYQMP